VQDLLPVAECASILGNRLMSYNASMKAIGYFVQSFLLFMLAPALGQSVLKTYYADDLVRVPGIIEVSPGFTTVMDFWDTVSTGPIAIEYDAGSYSTALLARKVETFALRFAGQYWGAPTKRKAESLRLRLAPFGLEPSFVLTAPWW